MADGHGGASGDGVGEIGDGPAEAGMRVDERTVERLVDRLAQKIEVRAQAVGGGRLALPEDRFESTARDDAGSLLHELAKELQAGRVEPDVAAFALDAKRFEVKGKRARSEAPRRIRAASAQQGLDARGELARSEKGLIR